MNENDTKQSVDKNATQTDSSKKTKFAHWGHIAKVSVRSNHKVYLGGAILLGVIVIIFVVMLSGGNARRVAPSVQQGPAVNNANILKENAKHIAELQQQELHSVDPGIPQYVSHSGHANSKAMKARRNAPTQMYQASAASQAQVMSVGSNNKHPVFSGHSAFSQYANSQASSVATISATTVSHPRDTIAQGEFIHAILETAINSELPGMVRAVVTRPVYGYLGEKALIPAGSRLIGQYASMSGNGSATTRIFIMWNRVITPSGISIMINSPGSDALGRSGMGADAINSHFFKIFGSATLLSILGYGVSNTGVTSMTQPNSADAYRHSIASSLNQTGQTLLNKNLNIRPTLYVHQGDRITVFVARDLDLHRALAHAEDMTTFIDGFRGFNV